MTTLPDEPKQPYWTLSEPYRFITDLQGLAPWGSVLDAGTGLESCRWISGLPTRRWTAVTSISSYADYITQTMANAMRHQDRIEVGNWCDPYFLQSEVYDTIIADYLVGSIEGSAPGFQADLFSRLAPHASDLIYVVGLDPYTHGVAATPAGQMVGAIGRTRDACQLLAGQMPYKEFAAEWVIRRLATAGFKVIASQRFPKRQTDRWVMSQLDLALDRTRHFQDRALALAMGEHIEGLRKGALSLCRNEGGLDYGYDYVVAARTS